METRATGSQLAAPAEVLNTVAFREALLRLGMITPSAPAASAVLIMAPRLCGSSISSHIIIKGLVPFLTDI